MAFVNLRQGLCMDGRVGVDVQVACTPTYDAVRMAIDVFLRAYDIHFNRNAEPQPLRVHLEGWRRGKPHVSIEPQGRATLECVLPIEVYAKTGWPFGHRMLHRRTEEGVEQTVIETGEYFFTLRYRS